MTHLYQRLQQATTAWRDANYPVEAFPAIAEILEWAAEPQGSGFQLRPPQLHALETYWWLRLVAGTPKVPDLYRQLFADDPSELLQALGFPRAVYEPLVDVIGDDAAESLLRKVQKDNDFVRQHKLQALLETLTLDYPSYILALAMGAGKTMLIGAVFASEFAMAMEYPDGPFVQNALVFAPGTTIIESLRELAETPYDRILPPRFFKPFAASVKLTFTRDGEKDIPVIAGSIFNVVVTNTEKIRIQKETIRKSDIGTLFASAEQEEKAKAEVANLRLQRIASLPHLAIFSDEAHHTYGQSLETDLKKVRKTVDYLGEQTNLICVVNTTGTPYFKRQLLKDVVVWYSLSQGIRDNILKEVADNVYAFSFDDTQADQFIGHVVEDFFRDYGSASLPNGAPARMAIYFPQTDDLDELRPVVEQRLALLGYSPDIVLENHSKSPQSQVDAFNRLNDPEAPHRVILLVNKGTEGWNCPSLFACALARRLRGSNNFVLQAASRCLRQVPGNHTKARIYLSMDNRNVLDRQLQESYGETIEDLYQTTSRSRRDTIRLRKVDIPPLVVKRLVRTVVRKEHETATFRLARPIHADGGGLQRVIYTLAEQQARQGILQQIADTVEVKSEPQAIDLYGAAVELAAVYRLNLWRLLDELRNVYDGAAELPVAHLSALAQQIEEQTTNFEIREEQVEVALALVKPDGFRREIDADGAEVYTAEISYPIDREHLLLSWEQMQATDGYGFHYSPYNFDSGPERDFFVQLMGYLHLHPDNVEDIYFTGALTTPDKTEFCVDYRDAEGKWRSYTPDFVIRLRNGRCLIVEIKSAQFEAATSEDLARHQRGEAAITVEGRKAIALQKWEALNPDLLKYHLVFAQSAVGYDQTRVAREFVESAE